MKFSRSYLLGLGSGLILSALITMVFPNQEAPPLNTVNTSAQGELKPADTPVEKIPSEIPEKPVISKQAPKNIEPSKETFRVPVGASAERIGELLITQGWITSKEEFLRVVKEKNLASKFQAGDFQLTKGVSIEEIINELLKE